ncbi:MAG: hypothetical protein SFW67_02440 [Myxococcaceae bacterium]|nr:hypothetical protein [Myxococcaceae bacterium]
MRWWALALVLASGCVTPLAALSRTSTVTPGTARFELNSLPTAVEDEARVRGALERVTPQLQRWGGLPVTVTVRIAPTHDELERAVNRRGYDWLRAWARYDDLIIQSPGTWAGTDRDVDELVLHELTHCLLFQQSGTARDWASKQIPLWFREGMATVTAEQGRGLPSLEDLASWLDRHADLDVFGDAERLSREAYGPIYGLSFHAMRFLLKRLGEPSVTGTMLAMKAGLGFDAAFARATGFTPAQFQTDFLNYLKLRGFRGFGLKRTRGRLMP